MKAESRLNLLFLLGLVAMAVFSSMALYRLRNAISSGSEVLHGTAQLSRFETACAVLRQIAPAGAAPAAESLRAARDVVQNLRRSEWLFLEDEAVRALWQRSAPAFDALLAGSASPATVPAAREAACTLEAQTRDLLDRRLNAERGALTVLQATISFAFAALSLFIAVVLLHTYRQARFTRKAEAEKMASEERWRLALAANNDGLFDWSPPTGVTYYSPQCTAMLGYPGGLPSLWSEWTSRIHPEDAAAFHSALADHLERRSSSFSSELRLRREDGTYVWVLVRAQASWDERNQPVRMVGCVTDISARKELEQDLAYKATHDALTGLLNRSGFESRLREHIAQSVEQGSPLTLCLCDIDHFKELNDTYGHQAGDEALRAFAQVLRLRFRAGDFAARLGGDEFAILLPATTLVSAVAAVERVREAVERGLIETKVPGAQVTASFGLASLPTSGSEQELLASADEALYAAKRDGRNRVRAIGVTDADAGVRELG